MTPVESIFYKKITWCVVNKREPFIDVKNKKKNWLAKKISKQTQKEVENFGTVIYKEFDKVSKEWLGKSFSKVISLVPEAGLTK